MTFVQPIYIFIDPIVHAPEGIDAVASGLQLLHFCQEIRFEFKEDIPFLMHISLVAKPEIQLAIESIDVGIQKVVNALLLSFIFYILVLPLNSFHFIFYYDVFAALQAHAVDGFCMINIDVTIIDHGVLKDRRLGWRLIQIWLIKPHHFFNFSF